MRRTNGVPASKLLAGIQIAAGYYAVAAAPSRVAPYAPIGFPAEDRATTATAPAPPHSADVTFAVHPESISNPIWLVFRGTREPGGSLAGEIVPDTQMRLLSLVPNVVFAIAAIGLVIARVLLPVFTGGAPSGVAAVWASIAIVFTGVWTISCGAAVHEVALNVQRDSPGAQLTWRRGLRWGSRAEPPPPPPPEVRFAPGAPIPSTAGARFETEEDRRRYRRWAWLGLLGLIVPIAIVMLTIVPGIRQRDDRADWVQIRGVAGAEVDVDHRMVTYTLPDGTEKTTEVAVMRSVEEGDAVDLTYPPGQPDLIEEDTSGYLLPYIFFGGAAALMAAIVLGRFAIQMRRSRRTT